MTQLTRSEVDSLRTLVSGAVIGPSQPEYDEARKVWNAAIDRRPAMIVRCLSASDVSAAIGYATEHGLEIAVRGGAHGMSGAAVVDDGLVIDLSEMNQIVVDPDAKRARVGGGALLGDVDAATQQHGLAVPAGLVSHTGVAGLTLGGGMGWLTRKAGLTIDNLLSVEVVVADGRIIRASEQLHPELFWAIRGGGGNFGVVTEFEFRLHEVGPIVQLAMMFWDTEQGSDVLRRARDLIALLPRDLNVIVAGLNAPPAPFVPKEHHFRPGYALIVTGFGAAESHDVFLSHLRDELPPLFEMSTPMPYVELQQMLDEANAWGNYCYDKGCYVEEISEGVIEALTDQMPRKASPLSLVLFYRLDGAYSEVGEMDTAFGGGRSSRYGVFIVGVSPTPDLLEADRAWVRDTWDRLLPHAIGAGAYINALTDYDEDRLRASYGAEKYQRLAQIKAEYDPRNVFHRNANIKPEAAV